MVLLKREKEQKFSTFVNIANGDVENWVEDPRLKLNLDKEQSRLQWDSEPSFPINAWVLHWHQNWDSLQTRLPRYHLYAYLQEPCYWSSHKISSRFNTTNFGLADCFQTAFEKSDKVLQSFKPELGTSLSTYAGRAYCNTIQDVLSQHQEIQISSELSLLKRCGVKLLSKALVAAGLPPEMRTTRKTAWQSFKLFYFPKETTARNLASLTQEDWLKIRVHYDALRVPRKLDSATEAELQDGLRDCVRYLRRYTVPQSVSLNAGRGDSEEFLEKLSNTSTDSMTLLMAQELEESRQQQRQKIAAILVEGLAGLSQSSQQLLQLYYGNHLTQTEIAAQCNSQQYNVSRQLRTARQALLKILATWCKQELHITWDATVLNNMTVILEDWLTAKFSGERN